MIRIVNINTGKERDASGLDYFGARYYDGQNLAFRWIAADSLTTRVYAPRSLNKYTYCRADPVNSQDPDGRVPTCGNDPDCVEVTAEAYPVPTEGFTPAIYIYNFMTMGLDDPNRMFNSGTVPGPNAPTDNKPHLDPRILQSRDRIVEDLQGRARSAQCDRFLSALIDQLKKANLVASSFGIDTLVSNLATSASITLVPVYDAQGSPIRFHTSYGSVTPGTNSIFLQDSIYLADSSYLHSIAGFTGDLYSTLLHEGLHLAISAADGVTSLTDAQIYDAMTSIPNLGYANKLTHSESIGGTFARYCGPS